MIKILVEQQKNGNGNKTTILKPKSGLRAIDALTALASPVVHLVLEATDNDREKSIEALTALLDGYIEANDIELKGSDDDEE